jgi:hypothetical protein
MTIRRNVIPLWGFIKSIPAWLVPLLAAFGIELSRATSLRRLAIFPNVHADAGAPVLLRLIENFRPRERN